MYTSLKIRPFTRLLSIFCTVGVMVDDAVDTILIGIIGTFMLSPVVLVVDVSVVGVVVVIASFNLLKYHENFAAG